MKDYSAFENASGFHIPSPLQHYDHYEDDFIKAMREKGVDFKDRVIRDGKIHRFATGKKNQKNGWYVYFGLAGAFGDWSQDIYEKWRLRGKGVSGLDRKDLLAQMEKARKLAEREKQQKQTEMAQLALETWNSLVPTGDSPYLKKKHIRPLGIRFSQDGPIIPLRDISGKLWSLQQIYPDGSKRFLTGGRKKGCFHLIGELSDGNPIILCEGYATGASLHMATQATTVIAFDVGNLGPAIEELKRAYPKSPVLIAGDDDRGKERNVGREVAKDIAQKYGCSVTFPEFKDRATHLTDFNDLHILEGLEEVKRQIKGSLDQKILKALNIKDLLALEVPPRGIVLGPILPEQGLVMIHAPRGIGKTHVSLLIAYTVASGSEMFDGRWKSDAPQKVLFVDGEMPLSVIQERLAKIVNSSDCELALLNNLRVITPDIQIQSLLDLSTPRGQAAIEEHLEGVNLLILDNYSSLCRTGRENEAESWLPFQEWFLKLRRRGLSVLLIHHSNKAGTQRGTSRKEDLLDTVITLKKPEDYDSREGARFEVHYEKARGFYGQEALPFEAQLQETDGKYTWEIKNLDERQLDKVVDLKKTGLTQREIAQETGLSLSTVNRRIKEAEQKNLPFSETKDEV